MFRSGQRPGERARQSAIFWVYHYAHRISHPARIRHGEEFPECRVCGDKVRYEEVTPGIEPQAWPIHYYEDFRRNPASQHPMEDDLQAA